MRIPLLCCCAALTAAAVPTEIVQDYKKDDAVTITDDPSGITLIKQGGRVKRYTDQMLTEGVHFRTGAEGTLSATILQANSQAANVIGVHGAGTHIRFSGTWQADGSGAYPMLVFTDGGRMTWTADAHVDLVMHPNYFTRQVWAWGDGTGTLELDAGYVSDRTNGATVADAMGTIRLAGLTLITHHSQSLPYNTRPDGRGGVYHNGHVVFEGEVPSTWRVASSPHIYSAQIDFARSGTIDCQAPLTHCGQRRDCLAVGNGGPFMSTGAFRTTRPDVTITKAGPAMLSLDGQQGYQSGARLVVAEGLLRMHTDPGAGDYYDEKAGVNLALHVAAGAQVYLAGPLVRLQALTAEPGATIGIAKGTTVQVSGKVAFPDGVIHANDGTLERAP